MIGSLTMAKQLNGMLYEYVRPIDYCEQKSELHGCGVGM